MSDPRVSLEELLGAVKELAPSIDAGGSIDHAAADMATAAQRYLITVAIAERLERIEAAVDRLSERIENLAEVMSLMGPTLP
jgi:hypothetical protein